MPGGALMNSSSVGADEVEHSWSSSKIHLAAFFGLGLVGVTGGRGSTTCSTYFRFNDRSTEVGMVEGEFEIAFSSPVEINMSDKLSSSSSLGGISFNTSMWNRSCSSSIRASSTRAC